MPMSNETTATVIRDNHFCGSVGDFLRPHLKIGANLSVVSACFTIYTHQALKAELDTIGRAVKALATKMKALLKPSDYGTQ